MEYTSVLEILSSSKISGRLSPFKPCVHCCRLCQMTAVATPLSPPFGDSGRQGREVVTFVEGQPHHTPRGPGTLPFPFGERHTRSSSHDGQGKSALLVTQSDFGRSVVSPPLSGRVPCPCACCFLTATATAGCSCRWWEYAADAVECVSCFHG